MKNLLTALSPFAPDQSGATAVLFELGGLLVICDAGGCTGNICGFDEPRWLTHKSALFSAGLRDMDAILGRDKKLIDKLVRAVQQTEVQFTAIIGTPVPTIIATDFRALQRLAAEATGLPALALNVNGADLYDAGAAQAWLTLFRTFATEGCPIEAGRVGVLGATPLDTGLTDAAPLRDAVWAADPVTYGMGSTLEDVRRAASAQKNLVIAPAALPAARWLQERFGTPYEVGYPLLPESLSQITGQRLLVIHQQVLANEVRQRLGRHRTTVASFFELDAELCQPEDIRLHDEEELRCCVQDGHYDTIIADQQLRRALPDFTGQFVDLPHFAVSGRLLTDSPTKGAHHG